MRLAIALGAAALVAGCATQDTFSYLDGGRWYRASIDTYDVMIIRVDNEDYIQRGYQPVRIEPGQHKIVVQGPRTAGFHFGEQRALDLDVKPCTRYWIAARKANRLSQDFQPYVDYSEPIAGCGSKTG